MKTLFVLEHPIDAIMMHPIAKALHTKKQIVTQLTIKDLNTKDILTALTVDADLIRNVVMYGASRKKTQIALLCKEMNLPLVLIHNDERILMHDTDPELSSQMLAISSLSTANFVHKGTAIERLESEGIQTPISLFECPITVAARNLKCAVHRGVVLIFEDTGKLKELELEMEGWHHKVMSFDLSANSNTPWKPLEDIYAALQECEYIVTDIFAFDRVARDLNKHMFYYGAEILDAANLGKSTHYIPHKEKLQAHLNKTWSKLDDQNPRLGIQPIINFLMQ